MRCHSLSIAALACLVSSMLVSPTEASWAYVPQEVRMLEAPLIVVGTIEKMGANVKLRGSDHVVGIIKVKEVLKGKPPKDGVRLAWYKPAAGGLIVSTAISYAVGQQGIWVLSATEQPGVFSANYPTDYQRMDQLETIKKKWAAAKKIVWSKPNAGLEFATLVEQRDLRNSPVQVNGRPVKAVAQLSAYPLVRNATKKPLHVVNYLQDAPFEVDFKGPAGKPISVDLFGNLGANKPPVRKHNFINVPPGSVKMIGYGLGLPVLIKEGQYSIGLTYKNGRDAGDLDIQGVWKGEIAAPTTKVKVPSS